jgi:hypothetical protein
MRKFISLLIIVSLTLICNTKKQKENEKEINIILAEQLLFLTEPFDEDNFFQDRQIEKDAKWENYKLDPEHGAGFLFIGGVIDGLEIFNNVTHRNECLSILPVFHDDLSDIYMAIHNFTENSDVIELLKFIVDKIEHIEKKIQLTENDCLLMAKDVRKVFDNVEVFFQKKTKILLEIFRHFFSNIGIFIEKMEFTKELLADKEWYRAGINSGKLLKLLFLWDYDGLTYTGFKIIK